MRSLNRSLFSSLGVSLLLAVTSCGGGSKVNAPPPPPPATGSVYVLSASGAYVYEFPQMADGTVPPAATIKGPAADTFQGLAIDAAGNIYVGDGDPSIRYTQLMVYPAGSSGAAKASITVETTLDSTFNGRVFSMEVDKAGNVYMGVEGEIIVLSPSNGSFVQSKVLAGSATTVVYPTQLSIDSAGDFYVANGTVDNSDSVLIFNSSADGNAAPASMIGGSKTMITSIGGVALDSAGNIYVASVTPMTSKSPEVDSILEFGAGSSGNVAPIRTITSTNPAGGCYGLRVDGAGNIYLLGNTRILKFAPNATGSAPPVSEIDDNAYQAYDVFGEFIALK